MQELLRPLFLVLIAGFFFLAGMIFVFLYKLISDSRQSNNTSFFRHKQRDTGEKRYQNMDALRSNYRNLQMKNHVPEDFFLNQSESYIMHMRRINQSMEKDKEKQ